jgi:UPF0755 protein
VLKRLIVLIVVGLVCAAGGVFWYAGSARTPAQLPVEFSITPGSNLTQTAHMLESEGLISQPAVFVILGRLLGQASKIKAGSYYLDTPLSPYQLLNKITLGETLMAKVTVIEGWNFAQMRTAIAANPRLKHDSANLSDAELLKAIGADEAHPEGLFLPETYYFDAGASDLDIYRRAYHALKETLATAWQGRASGLPYQSPYEVLIMASIIEKETGAADERPLIAAVFLNRLRIGMRLQTDPTVIYGLGERFDGNLRKVDLQTDTPYNTYTRGGLTPTPIALAGEAAIHAALHPVSSKALYFVAKGGGRHHFSHTLEEHNRAVNRYQRGGRG